MSEVPYRPRLRADVIIQPFSSAAREETLLLTLPDGRCLEVGRRLCGLLLLLDGSRGPEEIALRLAEAWDRPVTPEEVRSLIERRLAPVGLLAEGTAPTASTRPSPPASLRGWVLFPGPLLLPLTQRLRVLFDPPLAAVLLWAVLGCHVLFYRDFDPAHAVHRLTALSPAAYLLGYLLVLLSVLFHEFGHLSACRRFRCPHGEIRFGLYLLFPVFYANVSPSWRLGRKARVVVDLGGIYFQALLTLPAFLAYQRARSPLWELFFLELDSMILLALNPFLRFDGYWLCSDLLGIPNLHVRSRRLFENLLRGLFHRTARTTSPMPGLRPAERIGFVLYAGGRPLFAGLFLVLLARILPPRIAGLPEAWRDLFAEAVRAYLAGDPVGAAERFLHLLLLTLTCAAALRLTARGLRSAVAAVRGLVTRGLVTGRRESRS